MPVESLIRDHRAAYYAALNACNQAGGESTEFVEFMLRMMLDAIREVLSEQEPEQVSEQVRRLLHALAEGTGAARELMARLQLSHRPNFLYNYLQPALQQGLIEMTRPDKPRARDQKYRLSARGRAFVKVG